MTFPRDAPLERLLQIDDLVERAHALAREAHAGQQDKAHNDYYNAHLLDVHRRAADYGADADEQAAAWLHDIVEDTDVTEGDLLEAGFSDRTVLVVDLMTKRPGEALDIYYARLRAYEPARRLKLEADVASNGDPQKLLLVEPQSERERLTARYAHARAMLARR